MKLKAYAITPDGNYVFNNLMFGVKPYYLTPNNVQLNPQHPEQIVIPAAGVSAQISMFCVDEGGFEGDYLTAEYGRDQYGDPLYMKVEIFDDVRKRPITGQPCHIVTLFGTGQRPLVLPESLFLDKREAIWMRAYDLSGAASWIRPVVHGQRIFTDRMRDKSLDEYREKRILRARYMLPYICPTDEDMVLEGGAASRAEYYYTNDAIGHFEIKKLTYYSQYPFKFKITDEGGQQLSRDWVHATAGLGTAQYPFITYGSWVVRARGVVRIELESLPDAAGTYHNDTIYLTFVGRMFFV